MYLFFERASVNLKTGMESGYHINMYEQKNKNKNAVLSGILLSVYAVIALYCAHILPSSIISASSKVD